MYLQSYESSKIMRMKKFTTQKKTNVKVTFSTKIKNHINKLKLPQQTEEMFSELCSEGFSRKHHVLAEL
jgi:hypothetical protein